MPAKDRDKAALDLVLKSLADARRHHDNFVEEVDRLYRAYRGQVEIRSEAANWTSQYHPPYILQMVESMVAAMVDARPRVSIKPRPKIGDDYAALAQGAQTMEYSVRYALDRDKWAQKQRAWILQALICKVTVAKTYWRKEEGSKKSLEYRAEEIKDGFGIPYATLPVLGEREDSHVSIDDPCIEVRDVRDFLWPESATDVQTAPWVIDRVWIPKEHVKAFAASYGVNPDDYDDETYWQPFSESREASLKGRSRTKNLCEVLEWWSNDRVITVLNQKIVLRDDPNPFWHGQKPFVVTSAMPEPFQFDGISVVELVEHLQEMLWSLQNQRLDNLRLQNNMITLIRADVADVDSFEWAPGANWLMEDISQVKPLEINPQASSISLQAEALIKGDLQNVPGGAIFAGADSQTMDQTTATGVSIVSSIAQKLIQHRQMHFRYAGAEIVQQLGSLIQQFTREPKLIEIVGPGADRSFLEVDPAEIQGNFDYVADIQDESLVRQEKRAEIQGMLQVLAQVEGNAVQGGLQFNWKALTEDLLDAYDIKDKERYFMPAQQQMPPAGGPQQAGDPANQQGPGGVTNANAAAGPTAPSNQTSVSPEQFMQRLGAAQGGAQNV